MVILKVTVWWLLLLFVLQLIGEHAVLYNSCMAQMISESLLPYNVIDI